MLETGSKLIKDNKELGKFEGTTGNYLMIRQTELLKDAKYALTLPGKWGYVLCLHILSQWPEMSAESETYPLNPSSYIRKPIAGKIQAGLEALNAGCQPDHPISSPPYSLARKYFRTFNFSALWVWLCAKVLSGYNYFSTLTKKQKDYLPYQKVAVLDACWNFCRTDCKSEVRPSNTGADAQTGPAPSDSDDNQQTPKELKKSQESLLKWQIYHATSAIMQHRKAKRDGMHWFFVTIAALYAMACGTTIAGAVLFIIGTGGLGLPIAIACGLLTWWVNWHNGKFRIPTIMEEFFFMHVPKGRKPGFLARNIPGAFYYVDETTNQTKPFNKKQLFGVWLGVFGSLGVGLAIGALTWFYTNELAVSLGIAASGFFPTLLITIIVVTILAEVGLQLKSFIDIVRWDLVLERKNQFDSLVEGKGPVTKFFAYTVGIVTLLTCTVALFLLAWAGQQATVKAFDKLFPAAVSSTISIVSMVIAAFHFLGTLPFNLDMTITATKAGADFVTGKKKSSSEKLCKAKSGIKQASKIARFNKNTGNFIHRYYHAFILGFLITFAITAGFLSMGAGHLVSIPLLIFIGKSFGVGIGGGIVSCLFHRHELSLRENPETNPPFFAAMGNGILNGLMARSDHASVGFNAVAIVSNAVMSVVASFAGYDMPKSRLLQEQEANRVEKINRILENNLPDKNGSDPKRVSRAPSPSPFNDFPTTAEPTNPRRTVSAPASQFSAGSPVKDSVGSSGSGVARQPEGKHSPRVIGGEKGGQPHYGLHENGIAGRAMALVKHS